ncbi:hypothetical protein BJX76DRAFT_365993 [Aspergillus varians]
MAIISTSVEIAASPATVRQKFLDFPSLPTYTPTGFIRSITPADTTISPADLKPGDKLSCVVGYGKMNFSPVLVENSEKQFSWSGSLLGVFTGVHAFRFESSSSSGQEGTRLVHEERFSGLLGGIMGEGYLARWLGMREDTRKGFEGFNADFKKWVEGA